MNPVLTPAFIGDAIHSKILKVRDAALEEGLALGFDHAGGGDVRVTLFDADGNDIATAHVHLTGEGQ